MFRGHAHTQPYTKLVKETKDVILEEARLPLIEVWVKHRKNRLKETERERSGC